MPYKSWSPNEVLTAADVNAYLMRQSIAQFPDYAAGVAAIVGPAAGETFAVPDGTVYIYASGWKILASPAAYGIGGRLVYGVAAAVDALPGTTEILSVPFTLTATRTCKLEMHGGYSIITATTNAVVSMSFGFDHARTMRTSVQNPAAPAGHSAWGTGILYQSLAAGTHTADLAVINSSTSGAARVAANTTWAAVLDYG